MNKYKIGVFDSKIKKYNFRFYGITKNGEPHTGYQRMIRDSIKPICCKCGKKKTFFEKLGGLNEWWKYKGDKIYCEQCAPKNSKVCFIGNLIKYKTNFDW